MQIESLTVPLRVDSNGCIRIGQTRVLLELVVSAFNQGATADEIATDWYTALSIGEAYAAIAYYLQHRDAVDAYVEQSRQRANDARARGEALGITPIPGVMRERLLKRRAANARAHE